MAEAMLQKAFEFLRGIHWPSQDIRRVMLPSKNELCQSKK